MMGPARSAPHPSIGLDALRKTKTTLTRRAGVEFLAICGFRFGAERMGHRTGGFTLSAWAAPGEDHLIISDMKCVANLVAILSIRYSNLFRRLRCYSQSYFIFSFCLIDTQLVDAPMPQVRSAGPAQTPNVLTR
jgi:hypothetical protein